MELADLIAWRDAADAVAIRLVHAPGGQGKNWLAAQFAGEPRSRMDYEAARLSANGRQTPSVNGPGPLIVVDTLSDAVVAAAGADGVAHRDHAAGLRILLLSRLGAPMVGGRLPIALAITVRPDDALHPRRALRRCGSRVRKRYGYKEAAAVTIRMRAMGQAGREALDTARAVQELE